MLKLLTILIGKNCFTAFSTGIYSNRSFTVSNFFHMYTLLIKCYPFHCHLGKGADA